MGHRGDGRNEYEEKAEEVSLKTCVKANREPGSEDAA